MYRCICIWLLFLLPVLSAGLQAQPPETPPADSMLSVQAPLFSMKDMNGKTAKLADYRGKVVVLMFWSTWCTPCHQAFPAMQLVTTQYAGDAKVVFLFIDTREKADNYRELVLKDAATRQYHFPVLFDEKGPEGAQNKYYLAYGTIGIPTQFIIDSKGIIRYQLIGYNSKLTNEQSANQLQQLIEAVKRHDRL